MTTNEASTDLEYLQQAEGRVAYQIAGSGPLVVVIHGMGDVASTGYPLRDALVGAGYRVALLHLRGHGASDATFTRYDDHAAADDALALIDELGGGPAVLVGSSMGAAAAVLAAAERPDRVRALVLCGPFIRNPASSLAARLTMRVLMAGPWSSSAWLGYFKNYYPTRRDGLSEHKAEIKASLARPGAAAAFRRTTRTDHSDADAAAPSVHVPTLVVMGAKDVDFADPAAEAAYVANRLGGQTRLVDGAGHYPHAEFPEVVTPAVIEFLQQGASDHDA